MSVEVEYIDGVIVFFPTNSFEKEGVESALSFIACDSLDPDKIASSFEVSDERIYKEGLD